MSDNERDERGRFQPANSDEVFLEAVTAREPAGTTEIAEAIGVTRQNADQRLRQLEDEGKIASKRIGNSLVWSLAEGHRVVHHVDPDEEFWDAETYAGEEMSTEDIDDVLYG
ncbi:MAG: winged helix-turn-helix domain-containing protein [Haloarculaceae archaeon]